MKFNADDLFLVDYFEQLYLPNHKSHMKFLIQNIPRWVQYYTQIESRLRFSRPLCIVLDIDETILCNMCETEYVSNDGTKTSVAEKFNWNENPIYNPLLPLGRELIDCILLHEVQIVFISGRTESIRHETIENFKLLGLPFDTQLLNYPSKIMFHKSDSDGRPVECYKTETRKKLLSDYRIMLNVGDQTTDMGQESDINYLLSHPFYELIY